MKNFIRLSGITAATAVLLLGSPGASAATSSTGLFWGDWVGKGAYHQGGELLSCDQVEMVFSGSDAGFDFVSGGRTCGAHEEKFKFEHMDQKGDEFFSNGMSVGSIRDGNRIETKYSFTDPSGKSDTYQMQLFVQGDLLFFAESLTVEGNPTPVISANAMMERRVSRR